MLRFATVALLCLLSSSALASSIPCWKVRAAIAMARSVEAAEALARKHGYTPAEIAEARKCLK